MQNRSCVAFTKQLHYGCPAPAGVCMQCEDHSVLIVSAVVPALRMVVSPAATSACRASRQPTSPRHRHAGGRRRRYFCGAPRRRSAAPLAARLASGASSCTVSGCAGATLPASQATLLRQGQVALPASQQLRLIGRSATGRGTRFACRCRHPVLWNPMQWTRRSRAGPPRLQRSTRLHQGPPCRTCLRPCRNHRGTSLAALIRHATRLLQP